MYSGINTEQLADEAWKMATGELVVGNVLGLWDFTDGLSEQEWKERWLKRMGFYTPTHFITKTGRILIPELGIY